MNDNQHPFPDREDLTLALCAADNLADALAELLRYRRAGPVCNWPFGDIEVMTLLASAVTEAGRIEAETIAVQDAAAAYHSGLWQFIAAADKFLSDHCGRAHPNYDGEAPEIIDEDLPF